MQEIIKRWWADFGKSPEQKYLEASKDHYDLLNTTQHTEEDTINDCYTNNKHNMELHM